jgi:uncharacterized protein YprB with RNaseH-like and TPR domain
MSLHVKGANSAVANSGGSCRRAGEKWDKISQRWKEKVVNSPDYQIVKSEESLSDNPGFGSSRLIEADYRAAEKFKRELLTRYQHCSLTEALEGTERVTKSGICFMLSSHRSMDSDTCLTPESIRANIVSDLKLIYGIGEATEKSLKSGGYQTIADLTKHPRFGKNARGFLTVLESGEPCEILDEIAGRYSWSHPLALCVSGLHDIEDYLFVDIETMGLQNVPIFLIGAAFIKDGEIVVNQFFARDIAEEPATIAALLSQLNERSAFITFNGRTFDIPYINQRAAYYRIKADLMQPNYDLLYFARRAWGRAVPNCRLSTLEKRVMGIERRIDIPGALVPEFYETFLATHNPGPVIPIIEHNKSDLISLVRLFFRLWTEWWK